MRLHYVIADWWTALKHRHAFETAQRCASWKTDGTIAPRVTAPRGKRLLWIPVQRSKRTA